MASPQTRITIDGLARRTGLTTRNIRAYQSRGLLPPPEVEGRTGYYGDEHLERIAVIKEMQAEGFNLTAIQRLLEGVGGAWEQALGFKRAALEPWTSETPEFTTGDALTERFGADPELLSRAVELGVLVPLGGDRYEVPSPSLLRAGDEILALGIPLGAALEAVGEVIRSADAVAGAFVRLFLDDVIRPFRDAGMPEGEWPRVRDALERVRPLAAQVLSASFAMRMTAAVEQTFDLELAQPGPILTLAKEAST